MKRLKTIVIILLGINSFIFCQEREYLSPKYNDLNSLGYTYSEYDTISNGLYPEFYDILSQSVNEAFAEDFQQIKCLHKFVRIEHPIDTSEIKLLCRTNNVDAILITKIYFLSRDFVYKGFLNLENIYKPLLNPQGLFCFYVEIRIFDKNGDLVLNSSGVTYNGSNAKKSLSNGFEKAIKKAKKT